MDSNSMSIEKRLKTPRAAAVAGIVFAVLVITGDLLVWKSIPAQPTGSAEAAVANAKTLLMAFDLVPFAGIAFLWFIAVIRDLIGDFEDRFFATAVLGSGLLYVAMVFASAALAGGLLRALGTTESASLIESGAYTVARTQIDQLSNVYAIKMAGAFMLSTSTVALRTGIISRWLIYLSYALALFLLVAIGSIRWTPIVFPVWVLLISGWILTRKLQLDETVGLPE